MEREVGGGIRMGNTYKPMAVSFQCMTKFTTNKKKLKKKNNCLPQNRLVREVDAIEFLSGSMLVRYLFVTQFRSLLGSRGLALVSCPFNY